jgi:hypothetical protein
LLESSHCLIQDLQLYNFDLFEAKKKIYWSLTMNSRCFENKAFPHIDIQEKKEKSASSICVNMMMSFSFWPLFLISCVFFRWKANDILMIPSSFFSHLHHKTKI